MTPKEKAKELVDKMNVIHYVKLNDKNKDSKGLPISMYDDQIKQCALIAVDEILGECRLERDWYWEEVKQEIEKL
jgi:hypothetical protein